MKCGKVFLCVLVLGLVFAYSGCNAKKAKHTDMSGTTALTATEIRGAENGMTTLF